MTIIAITCTTTSNSNSNSNNNNNNNNHNHNHNNNNNNQKRKSLLKPTNAGRSPQRQQAKPNFWMPQIKTLSLFRGQELQKIVIIRYRCLAQSMSLSVYQKLDTKTAAPLGFIQSSLFTLQDYFSLHMKTETVTNQPSTQVCAEPISSWSAGERWVMTVMGDVQHVLFWTFARNDHLTSCMMCSVCTILMFPPRFDY